MNSVSRTISWYLNYYCEFIADWWSGIGFWDYVVVMILCLVAGWFMLRRPIHGLC